MEKNILCPPYSVEFIPTKNRFIEHVAISGIVVAEISFERGSWQCHFRLEARMLADLQAFRTEHIVPYCTTKNALHNVTRRLLG